MYHKSHLNRRAVTICFIALLIMLMLSVKAQAKSTLEDTGESIDNITNGDPVKDPSRWPWIAALVHPTQPDEPDIRAFCSGSLIAPNRVLTAAHCVTGKGPGDIDVVIGRNNLDNKNVGEQIKVTGISMYLEKQNPDEVLGEFLRNDVAVLKLSERSKAKPIDVYGPRQASIASPGTAAKAIGYGLTKGPDSDPISTLQEGNLTILSSRQCASELADPNDPNEPGSFNSSSMICAQDTQEPIHTSTCYGDSGGPLIVGDQNRGYVQVGVTSWGTGEECSASAPTAFAKLSAVYDFLTQPDRTLVFKPSYLTPSFLSGNAIAGHTLTCDPGTWSNNPSLHYRWYRYREVNDQLVTIIEDLSDSNGPTYKIKSKDIGYRIHCMVVAVNNGGHDSIGDTTDQAVTGIYRPLPGAFDQLNQKTKDRSGPGL